MHGGSKVDDLDKDKPRGVVISNELEHMKQQ
jgi:hypothetical protein